jgi:hypothetical protein
LSPSHPALPCRFGEVCDFCGIRRILSLFQRVGTHPAAPVSAILRNRKLTIEQHRLRQTRLCQSRKTGRRSARSGLGRNSARFRDTDILAPFPARSRAMGDAGYSITRLLNGPLMAMRKLGARNTADLVARGSSSPDGLSWTGPAPSEPDQRETPLTDIRQQNCQSADRAAARVAWLSLERGLG